MWHINGDYGTTALASTSDYENPDILILYELMNGLDKDGVKDMRQYLLDLKAQGKTILIASHSAEDIDVLCDTVCEMDKWHLEKLR